MAVSLADFILQKAAEDSTIQEYRTKLNPRSPGLVEKVQNIIMSAAEEVRKSPNQPEIKFRLEDIYVNPRNASRVAACLPSMETSGIVSVWVWGDSSDFLPAAAIMDHVAGSTRLQKVNLSRCSVVQPPITAALRVLELFAVKLPHAEISRLSELLTVATSLRGVALFGLECSTHGWLRHGGCSGISLDLSQHPQLELLIIDYCGEIRDCLVSPAMDNLREVHLRDVTITAAMLDRLYASLPGGTKVELNIVTIRHEDGRTPAAIIAKIRRECREVEEDDGGRMGDTEELVVEDFVFHR